MRLTSVLFACAITFTSPSAPADDACALTAPVRANIVRCASGLVGPVLGYQARFPVRLHATIDGRMTYRIVGATIGDGFFDVGTPACLAVARDRPGCNWLATGPLPSWTVTPDAQ
jgi:hypothetical protein